MSHSRFFPIAVLLACVGVVVADGGLVAQQPAAKAPAAETPTVSPAETKIRRALADIATLECLDTPLADVVEFLKDAHQIPIEIDTQALGEAGVTTDASVTRNLKGVTLRTALRLMLRDLNLTYTIDDEVLIITTPAAAAARPATRVYPVAHLLPADATTADQVGQLVRTLVQQRTPADGAASPSVAVYGPLLIVRDVEEGHHEVEKLLAQIAGGLAAFQTPQPPNPFEGGPTQDGR